MARRGAGLAAPHTPLTSEECLVAFGARPSASEPRDLHDAERATCVCVSGVRVACRSCAGVSRGGRGPVATI